MQRGGKLREDAALPQILSDDLPVELPAVALDKMLNVAEIAQAEDARGIFHVLQLSVQAAEDQAMPRAAEAGLRHAPRGKGGGDDLVGREQMALPAEMAM